MSDKGEKIERRTTARFGDAPSRPKSESRGAPLPLMTEPMIPLQSPTPTTPFQPITDAGSSGEIPTRVDHAIGGAAGGAAGTIANTKATALIPAQSPVGLMGRAMPSVIGPPPEIGLTQHHLPDEPPDPRLSLVLDPDSERSAAFRVLRHHLLEIGRPQCVVVASPGPGDGKTTTAVNLALALAECGRAKVLLVETHVRRPQLANIFKFVPPWCFYEQLAAHRHQPMLPWSLIEIPSMWLHVAAINPRIEKTQLLDGPAFAIAMERLRLAGYDHIVVDGPPVLGSADANLLADAVDAVVLACRVKQTTARDLRRAVDQLGANRVSGTVLIQ